MPDVPEDQQPPAIGGMATIPERKSSLGRCVRSIVDQLDHLHIYLNGYTEVPAFLKHPKITAYRSGQHLGDLGDAGKFFGYRFADRHYLGLDDDFVYPSDYVREMIRAAQRHPTAAAVGIHGVCLPEHCRSYLQDRRVFHWKRALAADTPVHILGTGVICLNTSLMEVPLEVFRTKNMADLWIGILAQQRHLPLICVAHRRRWLQSIPVPNSIFDRMRGDDSPQTTVVGTVSKWTFWPSERVGCAETNDR